MQRDLHCPDGSSPGPAHLHLDALGGIAGDMFVAALLDVFPEHERAALHAAEKLSGAPCGLLRHGDGVLTGARFEVRDHHHTHHHEHPAHAHTTWREIRDRLEGATLPEGVRRHATGIFRLLAEAEGRVHGIAPEEVTFHEVGSADSVADVVAASVVIGALDGATWSVGALPLGGGRVRTAHGLMPVPAPATALLLEGFEVLDDGIPGERVTPTGAAILRHLGPVPRDRLRARVARTGTGFGTKSLPGLSNILRVLAFAPMATEHPNDVHRELAVIGFEVDDQSGEDLACGLDRVRAVPGVHDVLQAPVFGKKSRLAIHVQVLVRPDALEDAITACFRETTTIGLRTHTVAGRALPRQLRRVDVDGVPVRVKRVERPGGATGKAESDDALGADGHAARAALRREAERRAAEMNYV
ncbi:MAG: LarC family nickel insertion protein [Acetobacteraceae bacterium]|nr:LarC family nickel insertion protein [Acetobacteraceae bacterium]